MKALQSCNINTEVLIEEDYNSLSAQIDNTSPLAALQTKVPADGTLDQAGIKKIVFRPRFFELQTNDRVRYITLQTKSSNLTPFNTIYLRVKQLSNDALVATSKPNAWPDEANKKVMFEFEQFIISNPDDQLYVEFSQTLNGTAETVFGIRQYVLTYTPTDPDIYIINRPSSSDVSQPSWRPVMLVDFYSWRSDLMSQTAMAEEWNSTTNYPIDYKVAYNGLLYTKTTNASSTSAPSEDTTNWQQTYLTSPDATFNVLADGGLCLQKTNGSVLWQEGYDLSSASSVQLKNWTINYYEFAASSLSSATFSMPATIPGKVSDFILDIKNSDSTSKTVSLSNDLSVTMYAVVQDGQALDDVLTIDSNELAELYFTQTAFVQNNLPVYKISKQVVVYGSIGA